MLKVAGKSMPVQTVGRLRDMQERSRNARGKKPFIVCINPLP